MENYVRNPLGINVLVAMFTRTFWKPTCDTRDDPSIFNLQHNYRVTVVMLHCMLNNNLSYVKITHLKEDLLNHYSTYFSRFGQCSPKASSVASLIVYTKLASNSVCK